ncbi:ATP-binding protein [Clostridium sp. chh4-2]|uniref:sensor histidine kinase n=1 Tax=Clostridium sp. chh4-2 TaxID=2067550 RepID=UPI001FA836DD|nr:ATP-binding protein [Clostridium sp. chh4-2]
MVLVFPVLDFMPYEIPMYWLFRHRLRLPFRCALMLLTAVTALNSAVFCWLHFRGAVLAGLMLMRYGFMAIHMLLAFLLIKENFQKLMFTYMLTTAWTFFVFGNANFIVSCYQAAFRCQYPYLVYDVGRILVYLITCPFMYGFYYRTLEQALKIDDVKLWSYFWKIPMFFTLFGLLYPTTMDVDPYVTWKFMFSRYFMMFGACNVSYVAMKVLEISRHQVQLEEALKYTDLNLKTQKKQYDSLAAYMDEARRARHDLRHHLMVMQSYIEKDDKDGLRKYIDVYKNSLPSDHLELYCRNEVMNAVIGYYAALARERKIRFTAKVDNIDDFPISDTEITVLLGNLLENAVEACQRESGDGRFIRFQVSRRGKREILILVDNSCRLPVVFEQGMPRSSKRAGPGIGTVSVRDIASRHQGEAHFEQTDGVFCASVYLQDGTADMAAEGRGLAGKEEVFV